MEALVRDTNWEASEARSQVLKVWKNDAQGLVGASSSDGTVAMAEITKKPVELAHVGFRAISGQLSNQKDYPTFLRVNPMLSDLTQAIGGFMKRTCLHTLYCFVSVSTLERSGYVGCVQFFQHGNV